MGRSTYLCHAWNPADEGAKCYEVNPENLAECHAVARRFVLDRPTYAVQVFSGSDLIAEYRGAEVATDVAHDLAYLLCDIPVYWPADDTGDELGRLLSFADTELFTAELLAHSRPGRLLVADAVVRPL